MSLWFGNREIQPSYHGRARSNSDTLLYLPDDQVLFVGDLAENKTIPPFPDRNISNRIQELEQVNNVDANTILEKNKLC